MRVRGEHWQALLEFCEQNPEIITNKFNGPDGKMKGHVLWQNVAIKLNSLGFGEKTKDEWRRALTDWKCKTKAKAAKIKSEMQCTGGDPANYTPLSEMELKLLSLMGKTAIEGDNVLELGFGNVTTSTSTSVSDCYVPYSGIPQTPSTSMGSADIFYLSTHKTGPDSGPAKATELFDADHSYAQSQSSPVSEHSLQKRKFSTYSSPSPAKRVRHVETQRLSNKLLTINEESLIIFKNIDKNIESIADSLKLMAEILTKKFL